MSWTKRDIVEDAYGELALASYTFDRSPEEDQRAARKLDTMMAWWDYRGIRLGYSLASGPGETSLDTDSGLPLYAIKPVVQNLAVELAGGDGKAVPATLRTAAAEGYSLLMVQAAEPVEQQMPTRMPRGAGNKPGRQPYSQTPDTSPIRIGEGGDLDFLE